MWKYFYFNYKNKLVDGDKFGILYLLEFFSFFFVFSVGGFINGVKVNLGRFKVVDK